MSVRAGETVSRQCPRRESYFSLHVERLSEARRMRAACFSIRLNARGGRP